MSTILSIEDAMREGGLVALPAEETHTVTGGVDLSLVLGYD